MCTADFEPARPGLRPEEMGGEDSGEREEKGQAASGSGGGAETGDPAASFMCEWPAVPTAAAQASSIGWRLPPMLVRGSVQERE